jgi:putative ABC transport system substrate-binding protein
MIQLIRRLLVVTVSLLVAVPTGSTWGQSKLPKVGVLTNAEASEWLEPFNRRLRELGWVEGENVQFEYRNAGGEPSGFEAPLAELIALKVDVLFPVGPPAVRAAFAATKQIPIVAHDLETDPVTAGYARSYSRPGANLTGLFLDTPDLSAKLIELLKTLVPNLSRAVVLFDSTSGPVPLEAVQAAAPSFGVKLQVLKIRSPADIDAAPSLFRGRPQALIVLPSPMMYFESARLGRLARSLRLPSVSMFVPFADAGGLFAYGPEMAATAERCAELVAKILSGAKPGDLPIERPTKFEFVLNLKAAQELRLHVPQTVMLRADRVIR